MLRGSLLVQYLYIRFAVYLHQTLKHTVFFFSLWVSKASTWRMSVVAFLLPTIHFLLFIKTSLLTYQLHIKSAREFFLAHFSLAITFPPSRWLFRCRCFGFIYILLWHCLTQLHVLSKPPGAILSRWYMDVDQCVFVLVSVSHFGSHCAWLLQYGRPFYVRLRRSLYYPVLAQLTSYTTKFPNLCCVGVIFSSLSRLTYGEGCDYKRARSSVIHKCLKLFKGPHTFAHTCK